jgi:cardiolipin synthase
LVAALQTAAVRGVDVRILLPDRPDHLIVHLSSFSYLQEMEDAGVKVFRYGDGFLHQKVLLLDDHLASVGTGNLDNRSFRLNFEISAVVEDKSFASEVASMLESDFFHSRQVTAADYSSQPIWFRAAVRVARIFAPLQ